MKFNYQEKPYSNFCTQISGFEGECPRHLVLRPQPDYPRYDVSPNAFKGVKNLEELTIGVGCDTIYKDAFKDCVNLRKINLECRPSIGAEAFIGTPLYKEVNGMKIVGDMLLDYVGTDEKVVIPEGVSIIGSRVFKNDKFTECHVKEVVLPESLEEIWDNAFSGSEIKEIVLGKNVKYIGFEAFRDCKNLTKVTIQSSLDYVGKYAFLSDNITELSFPVPPKECRDFDSGELTTTYDDGSARYHNGILLGYYGDACEEYTVAPGTWMIRNAAFMNAEVHKVNLPESLVYIGDGAFAGSSLEGTITIPETVGLGESVFKNTCITELILKSAKSIEGNKNNINLSKCALLESFVIPEDTKEINMTLEGCKKLKSMTLPEGVERFFIYCKKSGLRNVTLNDVVEQFKIEGDRVTFYVPDDLLEVYEDRFGDYISRLKEFNAVSFAPVSMKKVPKSKSGSKKTKDAK